MVYSEKDARKHFLISKWKPVESPIQKKLNLEYCTKIKPLNCKNQFLKQIKSKIVRKSSKLIKNEILLPLDKFAKD